MAVDYQQTDAAADDGDSAYCATPNDVVEEAREMTEGGTAGSTEFTSKESFGVGEVQAMVAFQTDAAWDVNEPITANGDWGAGDWTIRLNITTGNSSLEWDGVFICEVLADGTSGGTIASATALAIGIGGTGVKSTVVTQGSAYTPSSHESTIAVVLTFKSSDSGFQAVWFTPDQVISAPHTKAQPPAKPTAEVRAIRATEIDLGMASTFSSPEGASHRASQWQTDEDGGDFSATVFDSGEDTAALTEKTAVGHRQRSAYDGRLRVQDNNHVWSPWSDVVNAITRARFAEAEKRGPSGLFARDSAAAFRDDQGAWREAEANRERFHRFRDDTGILRRSVWVETKRENLCQRNVGYGTSGTTGWSLSNAPNGQATLTAVDDRAELREAGLLALVQDETVLKLDNSGGDGAAAASSTSVAVDTAAEHAVSAYLRGSGAGQLKISGDTANAVTFTPRYARHEFVDVPAVSPRGLQVVTDAGAVVYLVLGQLEEGGFATSPIRTPAAQSETRAADLLEWPFPDELLDPGGETIYSRWTADHDGDGGLATPRVWQVSDRLDQTPKVYLTYQANGALRATLDDGTNVTNADLPAAAAISAEDMVEAALVLDDVAQTMRLVAALNFNEYHSSPEVSLPAFPSSWSGADLWIGSAGEQGDDDALRLHGFWTTEDVRLGTPSAIINGIRLMGGRGAE